MVIADVIYEGMHYSSTGARRMYIRYVNTRGFRRYAPDDSRWGVVAFIGSNRDGWRFIR